VLVEQDLQRAMRFAGRAAVMLEGRIVLSGETSSLSREAITTAYFGGARHSHSPMPMPAEGAR
jgi:branched-chain amino acid transport system ATP-binding protein